MRRYVLSPLAERDVAEVLAWSEAQFRAPSRRRYERLLATALRDLASDPDRPGSRSRPEIAPGARTYHLRFSRDRARGDDGPVRRPRHLLLYRVLADGSVEVGRVIHDARELHRHLPPDYRSGEGGDE